MEKTGGNEFDDEAATVGEDVVDEDDACGDPRLDSLRASVEDDNAKEMTRSGCVTGVHVVASIGGVLLRASTTESPSKLRDRKSVV